MTLRNELLAIEEGGLIDALVIQIEQHLDIQTMPQEERIERYRELLADYPPLLALFNLTEEVSEKSNFSPDGRNKFLYGVFIGLVAVKATANKQLFEA